MFHFIQLPTPLLDMLNLECGTYLYVMVAVASGLTGVLFLSICVTSGVVIRRKSGIIQCRC